MLIRDSFSSCQRGKEQLFDIFVSYQTESNPFFTILGHGVEAPLAHCTFHPTVFLLSSALSSFIFNFRDVGVRLSSAGFLHSTMLIISGTSHLRVCVLKTDYSAFFFPSPLWNVIVRGRAC